MNSGDKLGLKSSASKRSSQTALLRNQPVRPKPNTEVSPNMKTSFLAMKLYQSDLYDSIKRKGNHIVSLSQPQTVSFLIFALLRHRASELHPRLAGKVTLFVEPDREKAEDRERLVRNHTGFKVVNLFDLDAQNDSVEESKSKKQELGDDVTKDDDLDAAQVILGSLDHIHDIFHKIKSKVNMVILDDAHRLIVQNFSLVQKIADHHKSGCSSSNLLVFMTSFIQNNRELSAIDTIKLISYFETLFHAKCETSGDLRCISRQAPSTPVEVLEFNPSDLVACDWFILVDSMLKDFCDFVLDPSLDNSEPLIKPEPDIRESETADRVPILNLVEQLILVRSALSDIIYSMHFLGFWCTKTTVKMYLSEFSKLTNMNQPVGDLIGAALSIFNSIYGRMDDLMSGPAIGTNNDIALDTASTQLKTVLDAIVEFKPPAKCLWPIGVILVKRRVIAKVIALWLDKIAATHQKYDFIRSNYILGSLRKHRNRMAVDNFDLHHEATIREVRFGVCNVLVSAVTSCDRSNDMPRSNVVISFDPPSRFSDYIQAKGDCRYDSSKYVIMFNKLFEPSDGERLLTYVNMERLLNEVDNKSVDDIAEAEAMKSIEDKYKPYPAKNSRNPATVWKSIMIVNRYCSKLPSDSFTKLSPEWNVKEIIEPDGSKSYYSELRLPVNSPERQIIVGPKAPMKSIAMRLAAFSACKILHKHFELDDSMNPITKESMKASATANMSATQKEGCSQRLRIKGREKERNVGSTKRRQYYKKKVAKVFSDSIVAEGRECNLYKFNMVLTCPIPDEQNRRGRRIVDPCETSRNFAIVCTTELPPISTFPLFTRSGEVMISVELVKEKFTLNQQQIEDIRIFHRFTFSKVLRLGKYPISFHPEKSNFKVLIAPVIDCSSGSKIDWDFVQKIVASDGSPLVPSIEERKSFEFNHNQYVDAVVIPWYRLTDRQQFAYYVAEICTNLKPTSPFPDSDSGFETFVDYYKRKYDITIYSKEQPVLDVDHTSARLNLLTPRYVNRKGRTLPSSNAKTRRESRESLVQKQLLIPELCSIHPFPASFWRKAVCLPCIFYRANALYLAEELRRRVANDVGIGFIDPPKNFEWPTLDFGWSLKQVIEEGQLAEGKQETKQARKVKTFLEVLEHKSAPKSSKQSGTRSPTQAKNSSSTEEGDFVIDHFDPTKHVAPDMPAIDLSEPRRDWANLVVISTSNRVTSGQPTGWDQPITQRDIFIEEEPTWSDCDLDFEGDISENFGQLKFGSPSKFGSSSSLFTGASKDTAASSIIGVSRGSDSKHDDGDDSCRSKNSRIDEDSSAESSRNIWTKSYIRAIGDPLTPNLVSLDNQNSDTSWSLTDEDDGEVFGDGDARNFGEWKDSKTKNPPLLREIFVPGSKSNRVSPEIDNRHLFELMEKNSRGQISTSESDKIRSLSANAVSSLKTKVVDDCLTHGLVSAFNKINGDTLSVNVSLVEKTHRNWYKLISELDSRVDSALCQNQDLFKHNAIELIAVDDALESPDDPQPCFGELLPNRDVQCVEPKECWKTLTFDPSMKEVNSNGPGPSVLLQALTMSNASDGINLERLETVGDSFLKYSITAYLHCTQPNMHEGKLSYLRSTEISNANLYLLGLSKNLGELMSATKFEPNDNWLPPGYSVSDLDPKSSTIKEGEKNKEIDKALKDVPYDLILQHSIPDKSIADCVEALIGAYLTDAGSRAALLFMHWLGLRVLPESFNVESEQKQAAAHPEARWHWLDPPSSPLICTHPHLDLEVGGLQDHMRQYMKDSDYIQEAARAELKRIYYANNLDKFEKTIGYTFNDKAFLVQAFTHNSFHENHVTDCHQRLEFLGDAILDYLITRYLFEDPRRHSPGTLTDLRSALVNNTFFASLAVKYQFQKYLMYISDELFQVIDGFVRKLRGHEEQITIGYTLLINEGETEYSEDVEVPKALGDVFESVAGAIYLDSNMSLDAVWRVYFSMMKPEIEYYSSNVPKSPIRELLESMPQNVRFSPSELSPDRKHRVIAEVFGLGRFMGVGRSKHSAKSTAAKRALRMLVTKKREIDELKKRTAKEGQGFIES